MSKTHRLKTLPWYFAPVMQGVKTFEIRRDDRGGFNVGDILILAEWDTMQYTGRAGTFRVTFVTDYKQQEGYVVMGIRPLSWWRRIWLEVTS